MLCIGRYVTFSPSLLLHTWSCIPYSCQLRLCYVYSMNSHRLLLTDWLTWVIVKHECTAQMQFHYASQNCTSAGIKANYQQSLKTILMVHRFLLTYISVYMLLLQSRTAIYVTLSLHADEVDTVLELKVHFDEPTPTCSDFLVSCLEMLLSTFI